MATHREVQWVDDAIYLVLVIPGFEPSWVKSPLMLIKSFIATCQLRCHAIMDHFSILFLLLTTCLPTLSHDGYDLPQARVNNAVHVQCFSFINTSGIRGASTDQSEMRRPSTGYISTGWVFTRGSMAPPKDHHGDTIPSFSLWQKIQKVPLLLALREFQPQLGSDSVTSRALS